MSPLADCQFWVDAQSEVILTTHIGTGVSFITAHMAYVSTSKTKLFKLRHSTFLTGADVSCLRVSFGAVSTVLPLPKPFGGC